MIKTSIIDMIKKDAQEAISDDLGMLEGLKNESIFITGGTGFMGTWLTEMVAFLNENHNFNTKVTLLCRSLNNFKAKAPHLNENKKIKLLELDVRNVMEMQDDITMVIHAAGNPDSRQHASDPLKIMKTISQGTDAVLAAASRISNLKKFIYISSGLIYGSQPQNLEKIPENYVGGPDTNSISSVYAESKRFAETICSAYRSLYKIPVIIVRPFAFIGPYQFLDKPWAINNFIRDGLMGESIRILGDGQTVRSYMYPSDMAFWLLRILLAGKVGCAYNLGSPVGITLADLAQKIASNFSKAPEIVSRCSSSTENKDNHLRFVPDTTLAQTSLGLKLKVDLDEAIKRTLIWFRETGIKYV